MSGAKISLNGLSDAQKAEFKQLTSAPKVAWPTVRLCAFLVVSFLAVYGLCLFANMPLWVGMLINSIVGYVAFSVIHDSIHRAISTNKNFNDAVGQIGMTMVLPYVDVRLFRWAHILHHRFANGDRDPDKVLHGAWYTLPFRWMAIDLVYFVHALRNADKVSRPFFHNALRMFAVCMVILAAAIYFGYGLEALMLWFIPSRLILLSLGFTFFWLPHVPHDVTQEENYTQATTFREGYEWLLGPVMQYQNYHLIHHLYPMTPYYNNYKVFKLLEAEIRKKDLAIQHGFAIQPKIYPAKAEA